MSAGEARPRLRRTFTATRPALPVLAPSPAASLGELGQLLKAEALYQFALDDGGGRFHVNATTTVSPIPLTAKEAGNLASPHHHTRG